MNFSFYKTLSSILLVLLMVGIGNTVLAQVPTSTPPPGTDPGEVILDGIFKKNLSVFKEDTIMMRNCLVDQGGYVWMSYHIEMEVDLSELQELFFRITVEDGNGSPRWLYLNGNGYHRLDYYVDLVTETGTVPVTVSGLTNIKTLSFDITFACISPALFPADVDLITSVDIDFDDGSGAMEVYPFSYVILNTVCPSTYSPGTTPTVPVGKTRSRLANSNEVHALKVGPVPFSQRLQLTQTVESEEKLTLSLWDIQGNKLKQGELNSGQQKLTWATQELASGIYLIVVEDSHGNRQQKKVVKID